MLVIIIAMIKDNLRFFAKFGPLPQYYNHLIPHNYEKNTIDSVRCDNTRSFFKDYLRKMSGF